MPVTKFIPGKKKYVAVKEESEQSDDEVFNLPEQAQTSEQAYTLKSNKSSNDFLNSLVWDIKFISNIYKLDKKKKEEALSRKFIDNLSDMRQQKSNY